MRALIAVDGSSAAEQAAVVADQILPADAELTLLDVVELSSPVLLGADGTGAMYAGRMLEDVERRRAARAAAEVDALAERLTDHDPEPLVDHGTVVERTIDMAVERAIDLVVVGTGDRSWWDHLWHGSVSRRLAAEAPCSVLVVRSAAPVQRVLVAVDGDEPATAAVDLVGRLRLDDVETTVVTIEAGDRVRPDAEPGSPEAYDVAGQAGDALGADAVSVAVDDDPVGALVAEAERHRADLVVVGTGDRSALSRLFDESVSRGVLDRAPCSVLVARPAARAGDTMPAPDGQEDR